MWNDRRRKPDVDATLCLFHPHTLSLKFTVITKTAEYWSNLRDHLGSETYGAYVVAVISQPLPLLNPKIILGMAKINKNKEKKNS